MRIDAPDCRDDVRKVARVIMVDQLWMWMLDEKTLITCFPKRYGVNNFMTLYFPLVALDCYEVRNKLVHQSSPCHRNRPPLMTIRACRSRLRCQSRRHLYYLQPVPAAAW